MIPHNPQILLTIALQVESTAGRGGLWNCEKDSGREKGATRNADVTPTLLPAGSTLPLRSSGWRWNPSGIWIRRLDFRANRRRSRTGPFFGPEERHGTRAVPGGGTGSEFNAGRVPARVRAPRWPKDRLSGGGGAVQLRQRRAKREKSRVGRARPSAERVVHECYGGATVQPKPRHHATASERVLQSVLQAPQRVRTPCCSNNFRACLQCSKNGGIPEGLRRQHFGVRVPQALVMYITLENEARAGCCAAH